MSRGRGGFGAGRGRGGKPGGNVPWAHDPDVKPDYKPSEVFPDVRQMVPGPITTRERTQVAHFRTLRDRIHEGPLYTVLGDSNNRVIKPGGAPSRVLVDPFDGMPTYTQKYRKKARKIPRLDTRPYVLRFFPRELWSTLDPDHAMDDGDDPSNAASARKKTLKIGTSLQSTRASLHRRRDSDGEDTSQQAMLPLPGTVIKTEVDPNEDEEDEGTGAAGGRGANGMDDDPENMEEEEVDDDYASDEYEMAGDYHAQGYFDDGADDMGGDDYDGGDGGDEGPLM